MQRILVTGAAGFIGFHFVQALAGRDMAVVGVDNVNDYYDVNLKRGRLKQLGEQANFEFREMDIADREGMAALFAESPGFDAVVHLAAQAGVRHSLERPDRYVDSNLVGFGNILEGCRHGGVGHLIFASSSSVYGANTRMPFSENDTVDHAISLYAATKKANEAMAHSYASLYGLPCTGLRFFTVYGPWGRPDMAYFKFTRAIDQGETIQVFNHGQMQRDFTYVDDVVEAMERLLQRPAEPDPDWSGAHPTPATSYAPYRIYNIGNHQPEPLGRLIELIEGALGRKAHKEFLDMQPGDVPATYADVDSLQRLVGFSPSTPLETGVARFVRWYRDYYSGR
ncbi:NAD-dependent epimerase [Natronospira bacteriovora]|uniref:NAD-dependent epimerase n=1 Tax=Natronospira bacteriovora TaxID=3069753 RepID=A0ABU0W790_9GAMM|nr:NAD-dependent epimerase [Natronospira sp. AB-CW4]MDQ2069905.1 NAD-dependent epimerase [Natronospira sp. AB-CW4]